MKNIRIAQVLIVLTTLGRKMFHYMLLSKYKFLE